MHVRELAIELRASKGLDVSESTVWRMMHEIGLTHKRVRAADYAQTSFSCCSPVHTNWPPPSAPHPRPHHRVKTWLEMQIQPNSLSGLRM